MWQEVAKFKGAEYFRKALYLSAMGVAEIAKSTNLKGCPHTFVCIVYILVVLVRNIHNY